MYQRLIAKFTNISFTIILGLCALLPLFFLSGGWSGLGAVKGVLLYVGVFLAAAFWLLAQFVDGAIKLPRHRVLGFLGIWVGLSLVSALTSANVHLSLWGRGFVLDSFAMTLVLALLAFLIADFSREQRKLVTLFLATFLGSVLTVFLQVALYVSQRVPFVSKYLAHVANQGTLVGAWIDFAYFVTFTFVLSLLIQQVLRPKGFFKFLSAFALVLSFVVLIFLNFKVAWIITIVSSLLVFVYKSSVERSLLKNTPETHSEAEISPANLAPSSAGSPVLSFVALLLGLFFFLSSGSIGMSISQYAGVNFTDIRPSFGATTHVMRATLAHDPLFGAGAGRFSDMWNLYHPIEINQTVFWNTPFDSGFGMLQTLFTTTGILATLALLLALVLSLVHGFKLFSSQFPDRFSRFIAVSSLVMLIAFVTLFIFASPGLVLVVSGFIYLGLLIGVSTLIRKTSVLSLQYLRDPRVSFFSILIVVLATMGSFTAVFFSGNRFASIILYNRALAASDSAVAEQRLGRALSLSQNDIYWRSRASLFVTKFTQAARAQDPDKTQLQTYFTKAEQSAQAAIAWDRGNATNWLTLNQVYQLAIAAKAPDAYANAKTAADEAQKRNPVNPLMWLTQAQLAFSNQDTAGGLDAIDKALALKSNYLDAYILRGQARVAAGETHALKDELTTYTKIASSDAEGYTLLGQAGLALKDYQDTLAAFAQARTLAPNDPNTSLNYINTLITMGQKPQAIQELQAFKARFPNVTGVDEQIAGLEKSAPAPQEDTPKTKN